MVNELKCPKCNGIMQVGFVADQTYGGVLPGRWVKGKPQRSFWFGTKISDRVVINVSAYRCATCGYIELYARDRENA